MNPFDPMPTIKAILGLPIYQEVVDARLLEKLDDFAPPQCEDSRHNTDAEHHKGAAKYLFISPCCHSNYYVCDAFALWLTSYPVARCARCDVYSPLSALSFIPIGGNQ